jgi:hypothetical protein
LAEASIRRVEGDNTSTTMTGAGTSMSEAESFIRNTPQSGS